MDEVKKQEKAKEITKMNWKVLQIQSYDDGVTCDENKEKELMKFNHPNHYRKETQLALLAGFISLFLEERGKKENMNTNLK